MQNRSWEKYNELVAFIRAEVRADILGAIDGKAAPVTPVRGKPGPKPKLAKAPPVSIAAFKTSKAAANGRRNKDEIEKLTSRLLAHLGKHPGQTRVDLATALKVPSDHLALPLRKLQDAKSITKKGLKSNTRYSAKA